MIRLDLSAAHTKLAVIWIIDTKVLLCSRLNLEAGSLTPFIKRGHKDKSLTTLLTRQVSVLKAKS